MPKKKSTSIIVIGIVVVIIGGASLLLLLRNTKSSSPKVTLAAPVTTTTTTRAPGAVSVPVATVAPSAPINFKIPPGENGLALQMDYFGGGGGYVQPGDQVNIYTFVNKNCTTANAPALVKLIQSNVKVLSVLSQGPIQVGGQPSSFFVAVSPQQAEQLIFDQKVSSLYFTLTTGTEAPAATTGINCASAL